MQRYGKRCCVRPGYAYRRRKKQANILPFIIGGILAALLVCIMPSWLLWLLCGAVAGVVVGLIIQAGKP